MLGHLGKDTSCPVIPAACRRPRSRRSILRYETVLAAMLVASSALVSGSRGAAADDRSDHKRCLKYGATPGTVEYFQCRAELDSRRASDPCLAFKHYCGRGSHFTKAECERGRRAKYVFAALAWKRRLPDSEGHSKRRHQYWDRSGRPRLVFNTKTRLIGFILEWRMPIPRWRND